jgi:uncharacterized glyoxalase superfamily protein PhnB
MTQTRMGEAFMPADEYGRGLPKFSVNLLVKSVAASLHFYRSVLQVTVRYSDNDFAALEWGGFEFMLHADHAYDKHPLHGRIAKGQERGNGVELRILGVDPDALEERARAAGANILHPAVDFPHGWREISLVDADGYVWVVGVVTPK